jgi:hypothetical protein
VWGTPLGKKATPPFESSPSLVTDPDRQRAIKKQEYLVLSLVNVDRNSATPCGATLHDQHLAVADGRVHQDLQGRAAHPGQLLVLTGGGEIGAQRHGATLTRSNGADWVRFPRAARFVFFSD